MFEFPGYVLHTLADDGEFALLRGMPEPAGISVLVTTCVASQPEPVSIARLEHAYALRDYLEPAWAVRPRTLEQQNGRLLLVQDDPGGELLAGLVGRPWEVGSFLSVAIGLARAVGRLHERGVIHKDIKPTHIFAHARLGAVWLTGFGIASVLPRERQGPESAKAIAGTLAYMAPEQTGRMNRSVDSRSDLYSVGVTLYEMLTGKLPFTASDPTEWIHCHVAREPAPISPALNGQQVHAALVGIVLKLLAKNAEDRYQTASGLESDLRRCLVDWKSRGEIDAFPLGTRDASDRLRIPEKLYGRKREVDALLAAFERVATHGTPELVLVSGYAGIGKSSIVNELHKVLVPWRGLFAAGKFDQFKRDIPYATLAQSFQSLVREILGKSDAEVDLWRGALGEALGVNGQLIVNLIPELEIVIGRQPPVVDLSPKDAQNRFQLVFWRFLGVFARPEHPLALFLDDLQWLDVATLAVLKRLIDEADVRHLLLVGAYRDNEVGPVHPLTLMLEGIRSSGAVVREIVLGPMSVEDVGRLVADSLHRELACAEPLARLVHEKTAGNPFFVVQFFTALVDEGLLAFVPSAAAWTWDVARIRAKRFTDNVVHLVASKLNRLPNAAQLSLRQFSCLGNVAEISTLALVHGDSEEALHVALWEAVQAGLIYRLDGAYTFLHDRVREAAYALIPPGERAREHLRIGRLLASHGDRDQLNDEVFEIVNHWNRGVDLIEDADELGRLRRLNVLAGAKAKAAIAHASARSYLGHAVALLPADAWSEHYSETFELYLAFSECEYLVGSFDAADQLFELILREGASDLDRAKVYSLRMRLYQVAGKYDDGVAVALDALSLFGVKFPAGEQELQWAIAAEFQTIPRNLGGRAIEELIDAPVATDPEVRAIINLLVDAAPCSYIGRPSLFPLIALKAVNLSLRCGNTEESSFAYAVYAVMLVSVVGDIGSAFRFSEMSLRLNDKFDNRRLSGTLLHLHADHINFWRRPFASGLPLLDQAFLACLEVGDLVYAGFLAFETVWQVIEKGDYLDEVLALSEKSATFARQSHNEAIYQTILLEQQFVKSLQGKSSAGLELGDDGFNAAACLASIANATFGCGVFFYHVMKQMLAFLDGRHADALDSAAQAEPALGAAMSMPIEATYHFYHALSLTALYPTLAAAEQVDHARTLELKLKKLELWAGSCPENYHNRHALVAAEVARIEGRVLDAMHLYEESIRSARDNGFVQNQGLANELCGQFYAARGFETIAHAYLRDARYCYDRWGANGKVQELDRRYPLLRRPRGAASASATFDVRLGQLDFASVVKMSQAVSGEIVIAKLIERLLVIAVEHAGAARGLLILPRNGEQRIEAEATARHDTVTVRLDDAPVGTAVLPASILRFVVRTQASVILDDASVPNQFSADAYLREQRARSILCLPLTKQARLIGVLYLENNLTPHVFTKDRIGVLELLAAQAAISLENARLYTELQQTQAYLAEAQRLSRTGSFSWRVESAEVVWSEETFRIFGCEVGCKPGLEMVLSRTHPDDVARVAEVIEQASSQGRDWEVEHRLQLPDGSIKNIHVAAHALRHGAGNVEFVGAVSDVTATKRAEERLKASLEEKEALLREVHHRVKNNLQLISSLLSLQAARAQEQAVAELFADSRNRVRSMALVHENLYRAGNFNRIAMAAHVTSLCAHLARAHGIESRRIELESRVDDLHLNLDQAVSCGLIINELVSNALKHAFPSGRCGRVWVGLHPTVGDCHELEVADDGVGLPAELETRDLDSLGLQLVKDLTQQLRGSLRVERNGGTSFSITFDANGRENRVE